VSTSITVNIIVSDDLDVALPVEAGLIEDYGAAVLGGCGVQEAEVNVIFVSDDFMTELNKQYKGREGTTDVLSFNLSDDKDSLLEGEIYISYTKARGQAVDFGQPFDREILRLVTHGLLHLSGRVHVTPEERDGMERDTDMWLDRFYNEGGMS